MLNVRSLAASGRVTRILSEVLSFDLDFLFMTEMLHKDSTDFSIRELTADGYQNFFQRDLMVKLVVVLVPYFWNLSHIL